VTVAAMLLAPRLTRRVPPAILGLGAGVACYFALAASSTAGCSRSPATRW